MAFKSTHRSRRHRTPRQENSPEKDAFFQPLEPKNPVAVQPKLTVGAPDDKYEREADNVADRVVSNKGAGQAPAIQSMADSRMEKDREVQEKPAEGARPQVQRKVEGEEEPLQAKSVEEEEPVQTMAEEEEPVQAMPEEEEPVQAMEEEEPVQAMPEEEEPIQMMEEEEPVQAMPEEEEPVQAMEEEEPVQAKSNRAAAARPGLANRLRARAGKGRQLGGAVKQQMESGFGRDFSGVNVHTDAAADEMNRELGARAFARGQDVYFKSGEYNPDTTAGQRLLAHELTHTVQQGGGAKRSTPAVQAKLGDGHDLASPRFSKILQAEAAYDREKAIKKGSKGRGVLAVQHALYDLGYHMPKHGIDGDFGTETKKAVIAYQKDVFKDKKDHDGVVGPKTMEALDARFGKPKLPKKKRRDGLWDKACVLEMLCPWSPHTVDVIRNRITLKSFDRIFWTDQRWDGKDWVDDIFEGGGYHTRSKNEIGILNKSCERVTETLYHEILHSEQPTEHDTTAKKEGYAYRIGEEFSIAMGMKGRPKLRSTDAQGREFADEAKVDTFVADKYPSVPGKGGGKGEEILGKGAKKGEVRVKKPDGTIYTRPAKVGEKVDGPKTVVNGIDQDTSTWTCP